MSSEKDQYDRAQRKQALVLIVDDHKLTRELLKTYLRGVEFATIEAENGQEALSKLASHLPDLVILDLLMPLLDGFEVCRQIKENPRTALLPVIVATGLDDFDAKMKALEAGADDFIHKPVNEQELLMRVKNHLRIKQLTDDLENAENVIVALIRTVEAKDPYTRGHSERVAKYARKMAESLKMDDSRMQVLRRAAMLHDLGKIGLDDAIIRSPDKLTNEEREKVHNHPSIGIEIIKSLSFLSDVLDPIRAHHERFDGTGYPARLARDKIPVEARIIAVADTYDALTTDRPYRKAVDQKAAFAEMEASAASGQLDPNLVAKFIEVMAREERESPESQDENGRS
ncbi:MAG: response regulator [Candidatus Abyssobacteria bacterium SURF_5]|uniref:Response regulator n=1 Tax=Abyssobacteria bacterium (strain SURF_5) TaxID=2093360 RepID=A0A3A4P1S1_ABYX5|nr:MAG: response regulator [Candidatus Abyssubacteria bacterium SURF_5]